MAGHGSTTAVVLHSSTAEKTAEQETGSAGIFSLEDRVNAAFKEESLTDQYRRIFQAQQMTQQKTSQTNQEGATNLLSIGSAVYEVFYGNIKDIRAWSLLYGPIPALVLAIFGRKSVWKMQAELLVGPVGLIPMIPATQTTLAVQIRLGVASGQMIELQWSTKERSRRRARESEFPYVSQLENRYQETDFGIGRHHCLSCCYRAHSTKPKSDSLGCSSLLGIQPRSQLAGRLLR